MIEVEFVNLPQVFRGLAQVEQGIENLKPLWEKFGKEFYAEEKALFNAAPWKPLSPAYAPQKARRFPGKGMLRATDTLFKSLTEQGAAGNVSRINNQEAEFGSNIDYGLFHQFGTSRMPARPPLAEPEIDRYDTIAGSYLFEIVKNAGFN